MGGPFKPGFGLSGAVLCGQNLAAALLVPSRSALPLSLSSSQQRVPPLPDHRCATIWSVGMTELRRSSNIPTQAKTGLEWATPESSAFLQASDAAYSRLLIFDSKRRISRYSQTS